MSRGYALREQCYLTRGLVNTLLRGERFVFLDVGAGASDANALWRGVLDPENYVEYSFEPEAAASAEVNASAKQKGINAQCFPAGLWGHEGRIPFHVNSNPGSSSFLPYNHAFMDRLRYRDYALVEKQKSIKVEDVAVTTLSKWMSELGIDDIDFVKMNTQGAELEVLGGAKERPRQFVGLLIEVSFCESYVGRPLFGEVDSHLRRHGLAFFDFVGGLSAGRIASPVNHRHVGTIEQLFASSADGQLLEGHALYLRDPVAGGFDGAADAETLVKKVPKLACLAEQYGQVEFAFESMRWLEDRLKAEGRETDAGMIEKVVADAAGRYASRPPRVNANKQIIESLLKDVDMLRSGYEEKIARMETQYTSLLRRYLREVDGITDGTE